MFGCWSCWRYCGQFVAVQHRGMFECGGLLAVFGAYYCFGMLKLRILAVRIVVKLSIGVPCV